MFVGLTYTILRASIAALNIASILVLALVICTITAVRERVALVHYVMTSPRLARPRLSLSKVFLEWLIGQPVLLSDVQVTGNSVVFLGVDIPNPVHKGAIWSHPSFATAQLIEVRLAGANLFEGALALLGTMTVHNVKVGCGHRKIDYLRVHGVAVFPEETAGDGISNASLVYERLVEEIALESMERCTSEEDWSTHSAEARVLDSPHALPSESSLSRRSFASSRTFLRGIREAMLREGLALACGETLSQLLMQPQYGAKERDEQRTCFAAAQQTLEAHLSIGRLLISSMTVVITGEGGGSPTPDSTTSSVHACTVLHPNAPSLSGKRALHVDGPVFELCEYHGGAGRLGAVLLSGCLSRLLRDRIHETRVASERCVREAAQHAKSLAASSSARAAFEVKEAAKGAAMEAKQAAQATVLEAKEAALEAKEVVQTSVQATAGQARAVVESGATYAKRHLYGMAKLGIVGWSDANSRTSSLLTRS